MADGHIHSLSDLRTAVESLRIEKECGSFDAETYYTKERVTEYANEFAVPQDRHTRRCMYLLGIDGSSASSSIVLDIGCGSGLSTKTLKKSFGFTVGIDLSSSMLDIFDSKYGDCILANMAHSLPFRPKVFDACSSTSAVHYLLDKPSELSTLLASLDRIVTGDSAFQLFPRGEAVSALAQIEQASPWPGFSIIGDKPHKKDVRWYVLLSRRQRPPCPCALFPGATCLLRLDYVQSREVIEEEYWAWLEREHARFSRRQARINALPLDPHS